MKLWRSLSARIVLVSLVLAVVGTMGINLVLARLTLEVAAERAGSFLAIAHQGELGAMCRRAPQDFYIENDEGFRLWALDEDLKPHRDDLPRLPDALLEGIREGHKSVTVMGARYLARVGGGVLARRVADHGPCAVYVISWPRSEQHIRTGLWRIALMVLLSAMASMGLALFLVVRPLTRRIQVLKEAAAGVGGDAAYEPSRAPALDELDEVRAALDQAHARIVKGAATLEQKNRALMAHLSDVAHDLRTPIAALQLKLERLGLDGLAGAEREEERLAALSDALYLEALCENLRFAATLREGLALEEATCDLGRVVERVRDRLAVVAQRRGVSLEVAIPDGAVLAPMARVVAERLLSNLVANAIVHHHPADLDVERHVAVVLERSDARFVLRVIDDGPGLPAPVRARLAQVGDLDLADLREASAAVGGEAGTGLGLLIVTALGQRAGLTLTWAAPDAGGLEVVVDGPLADG